MKQKISLIIAVFLLCTAVAGCDMEAIETISLASSSPQQSGSKGENGQEEPPESPSDLPEKIRYQASFLELFDTVTFVVGYAETEEEFQTIVEEFKVELKKYHELYDIYNTYPSVSNIKTINDNAGKEPVQVDEKLINMLIYGKELHVITDGLTNIAMGSVLKIWHNYREDAIENGNAAVPPMEELKQAALHMNIDDVVIDEAAGTVLLQDGEMSLDVGSLGKGYAVEQVCKTMEQRGYNNIMLSVGGNIKAIGGRLDGTDWRAGVENPYGDDDFLAIVGVNNNTIVTSGNYQRYYMVDGIRYHHIINPKTLMPENHYSAVAVLCDDSGYADGISTALFNLSLEEGTVLVEEIQGLEAMWMLPDETMVYSSGFEKNVIDEGK